MALLLDKPLKDLRTEIIRIWNELLIKNRIRKSTWQCRIFSVTASPPTKYVYQFAQRKQERSTQDHTQMGHNQHPKTRALK